MKQLQQNQKGFSAVELLIILLIILFLILGGWFVWKKTSDKTEPAKKTETSKSESKTEETPVDPTSDWVLYTNAEGVYSLKHPKTWVKMSNPEMCNPGLLLIAPEAASVGKCATEHFGQIAFSSHEGDLRSELALTSGYTDTASASATADGVTGTRATGTVSEVEGGIGGVADGTKIVRYVFYTGGKTYSATYYKNDSYPTDALETFDIIVTKTLKFSI